MSGPAAQASQPAAPSLTPDAPRRARKNRRRPRSYHCDVGSLTVPERRSGLPSRSRRGACSRAGRLQRIEPSPHRLHDGSETRTTPDHRPSSPEGWLRTSCGTSPALSRRLSSAPIHRGHPAPLPGAAAHAKAGAGCDLGRRYAPPAWEWKTEKTELKNKKIFVCAGRRQALRPDRTQRHPAGTRQDDSPCRHQTEIGMRFGSEPP